MKKLSEYFKINLEVRFKNKLFWLLLIPILLTLVRQIAALFGVIIDFESLEAMLKEIVKTVFTLLSLLGIVVDPTTEGIKDSDRAMEYKEPSGRKEDKNVETD